MRSPAGTIANGVAWAAIGLLVLAAILVADRLGFAGLFLLGGLTLLVCVGASLDQQVPTWGVEVFRAAAERHRSPEDAAKAAEDRRAFMTPLRFFAGCGVFLAVVGAIGFAWQLSLSH